MSTRAARDGVGPTRRAVLLGAAALLGIGLLGAKPATSSLPAVVTATIRRTLVLGSGGPGGFRRHVVGSGEPWMVRAELAPAHDGRDARRRPMAAFVQFTDMHVQDTQTPARHDRRRHRQLPVQRAAVGDRPARRRRGRRE